MAAIGTAIRKATKVLADNSPKILTAMAVTGVVSTTVLAVQATPEAMRRIDEAEEHSYEGITPLDKAKLTWTCYIPATAVGLTTIACILGGHSVSTRRNAALMSMYTLTDNGFREYQAKIVEVLGKQKEQKARDEINQARVDANPVSNRKDVVIIAGSTVLMYDPITDRYFQSDFEDVRKAVNDLNQSILTHMGYASQNDFYRAVGLPPVVYGDESGWNTDNLLEIDFTTTMSEDNRPCAVMNYRLAPIRGYDSFHR
jgi:hypothetical protein